MATIPSPKAQPAPAPAPEVHPDFQRPPAGPAAAPAAGAPGTPQTIPLPHGEYTRLLGIEQQYAAYQREQATALQAMEDQRLKALAEKGQIEEALKQQKEQWERRNAEAETRFRSLESQIFSERRDRVITEAFTGREFVGETPEQKAATAEMLRRILQDDFETVRDASNGALSVVDRTTRRPAPEVITELLQQKYTHLFAPTLRGGAGVSSVRVPMQPPGSQVQPGSLQEIAAQWQARQGQYPAMGLKRLSQN